MKQVKYICTVCPKSCDLLVTDRDGDVVVEEFGCKRGKEHAMNEYLHPMRVITSTVKVIGGEFSRLGVIGTTEVPRDQLQNCLKEIYKVSVTAPVKAGDVVLHDVLGTGCDIVATMTIA